jgi:hypothetical protein
MTTGCAKVQAALYGDNTNSTRTRYCLAIIPYGGNCTYGNDITVDSPDNVVDLIHAMTNDASLGDLSVTPLDLVQFSYFQGPVVRIEGIASGSPTVCLLLKSNLCVSCLRWNKFLQPFGLLYLIYKSNGCAHDVADEYFAAMFAPESMRGDSHVLRNEIYRNKRDISNGVSFHHGIFLVLFTIFSLFGFQS